MSNRHQQGGSSTTKMDKEIRESYRQVFMTKLARLSDPTAGSLIDVLPRTVFYWLRKHDRAWLRTNMPPKKKSIQTRPRKPSPPKYDFSVMDAPLAEEVTLAAARLRQEPSGRTRITVKAIGKKIGKVSLLEHH